MFLGLLEVASRDQQIGDVNVGLIVLRLKLEGAAQFLVGTGPFLQLEVSLGQLVVSVSKARIHLSGVAELDGCFAILALFEVALSALEVFLLAHIGITGTAGEQGGDQSQGKNQTEYRRMPHCKSPDVGTVRDQAVIIQG